MLVVMQHHASQEDVDRVCQVITKMGFEPRPMPGEQRTAIGLVGNDCRVEDSRVRGLPGVARVIHVSAAYKQVSREWRKEPTVIELFNGARVGGNDIIIMGGPCSVESEDQLMRAAECVAEAGGKVLRGGAFKPRTSPYAFQGLGEEGLELLAKARDRFGLAIITEALDPRSASLVAQYADILQIGARNMQNFALLKEVGRLGKPVMLKRGMAATIKEWLLAAEYVLNEGNGDVMLCERGIRSFDSATRNVMDVAAIPLVKGLTHLPVIGDPSHATGVREMVTPMARAAVAAGADGIIVETHPDPNSALSDGPQALYPDQFRELVRQVAAIAPVLGRGV
jgi:3-deoxy-7-phosphoheptulonate synthase